MQRSTVGTAQFQSIPSWVMKTSNGFSGSQCNAVSPLFSPFHLSILHNSYYKRILHLFVQVVPKRTHPINSRTERLNPWGKKPILVRYLRTITQLKNRNQNILFILTLSILEIIQPYLSSSNRVFYSPHSGSP